MILKNSKNLKKISFVLLVLSFISSCGGSGGSTPVDTSSSDWDSMVWDQDNWG